MFILKELAEKSRSRNNKFLLFVDLEKAFDQVLREVICIAMRWKGILEYLVNGFMSLSQGRKLFQSKENYQILFL